VITKAKQEVKRRRKESKESEQAIKTMKKNRESDIDVGTCSHEEDDEEWI